MILLAGSVFSDATVITSASCTAGNFTTSSSANPASCSASYTSGSFSYSASANVSGSDTLNAVTYTGKADADGGGGSGALVAKANASGSDSLVLDTAGPVRSGFLVVTASGTANNPQGFDAETMFVSSALHVGSFSESCGNGDAPLIPPYVACSGSLAAGSGVPGTVTVPFTLGQAFVVSSSFSAAGMADTFDDVAGDASGTITYSYSFENAQGAPVAVYAAPEPGSQALLMAGGLVLLGMARRRRRAMA